MTKTADRTRGPAGVLTVSNGLSLLRLLLTIPLLLAFKNPWNNRLLILAIGLSAYISDLLDGFIARRFGQESAFGRIIDPLADKVFVTGAAIGLLTSGLLPLWFVIVVISRDVLIFLGGIYVKLRTGLLVQSNFTGKAAVVSIGLVMGLALFGSTVPSIAFNVLLISSLALLTASFFSYARRFAAIIRKKK